MIMQVDVKYIKTLKLSLHKKIMCASMEAMESWTDGMVCILIFNGSSDSLPAGIVSRPLVETLFCLIKRTYHLSQSLSAFLLPTSDASF